MSSRNFHTNLFLRVLEKEASKIGIKVMREKRWGVYTQIIYPNGKVKFVRYGNPSVNPDSASFLARDKDYTYHFLKAMGYPTIPGEAFFSNYLSSKVHSKRNIDAGWKYAKKIGLPVIVKPNSGSQGVNVSAVYDKEQYYRAVNEIFKSDDVVLVQKYIKACDFRIVVFDGKVIACYQRLPLKVTGARKSTISELLEKKARALASQKRSFIVRGEKDVRIINELSKDGFNFKYIPKKGRIVQLLSNANLSSGGKALDFTDRICPYFSNKAIEITKKMGLKLCGVDLFVPKDITNPPKKGEKWYVIEINSSPGLDGFASSGRDQKRRVVSFYKSLLRKA